MKTNISLMIMLNISDEIKHMSKEELDKEIDKLEKSLGLTKKAASAF